jgi:prolyl-tRNA synthetase
MKQSKLFYKTEKRSPKDADALSHALLVRAGFIDQLAAGVYSFLPLGFLVLKKIEKIIREEMEAVGGQEVLLPVLGPKENWEKTGRWKNFEELFKLKGQNKKEYVLNPTHEEIISPLAKKYILSYKDLPIYLFQIQTKFRNELRVKSGLLRTREFLMKDLYSFHSAEDDLDKYYEKVSLAYDKIFKRCGVKAFKVLASGGSFSKYSHEFQVETEAGEDIIFICKKCKTAFNKELGLKKCPECGNSSLDKKKAVEVGNIFKLGTKYSLPFELKFKDKDDKEKPVIMGCYGIGLPRLMAAVVETNNDKDGIIWPGELSPFDIHLISLGKNKEAEKIYNDLQKKELKVLYDDRDNVSAGEKFAEADLIGISKRVVVSEKTLTQNSVEVKQRSSKQSKIIKTTSDF